MVSYPGFTFLSVLMDDTVVIATTRENMLNKKTYDFKLVL